MNYNHDPWIKEIYASYARPFTKSEHEALKNNPETAPIVNQVKGVLERVRLSCNLSRLTLSYKNNWEVPDQMYTDSNGEISYVLTTRIGRRNQLNVEGHETVYTVDDETYDRIQRIASGNADPVFTADFIRTPQHFLVVPDQSYRVVHGSAEIYTMGSEGPDLYHMTSVEEGASFTVISTHKPGWLVVQAGGEVGKIPIPEFNDMLTHQMITPDFNTDGLYS